MQRINKRCRPRRDGGENHEADQTGEADQNRQHPPFFVFFEEIPEFREQAHALGVGFVGEGVGVVLLRVVCVGHLVRPVELGRSSFRLGGSLSPSPRGAGASGCAPWSSSLIHHTTHNAECPKPRQLNTDENSA